MSSRLNQLRNDLDEKEFRYSTHLARRLFQRNINKEIVKKLILEGELIEEYQDDFPCPSMLLHGKYKNVTYHLVVANCESTIVAITIYLPDPVIWDNNRRRMK